ncbi:MAG: bifunctional nuclease family protein [Desulfobacterales bacterium]|nr:bifunctional nuclease family protein [Desulfobacterales bacterium]
MLHEATIDGMIMDPVSNSPIVILKLLGSDQSVPIWIGLLEATSIASALQDTTFDRPMTHDLFKNFMETVDVNVLKIEVSDLVDNTYYAKIYFVSDEQDFVLDSRPSDAIAIAVRLKAPIFIDDQVLEKSKQSPPDGDAEVADKSDEGKKWAEYLENLSPDDFGKFKI